MAGPGIPLPLGTLDHQDIELTLAHLQYHGHRRPFHQAPQQFAARAVISQAALDKL
jgi:hypothetical protein